MNKNKPARYGLLKRFSKDPSSTVWFELPSHYCFHFGNAWEENTNGEEKVILWGSKLDNIDFEMKEEHPFLAENWNTKTTRFEFNLTTGEDKMESYFPSKCTEFPIVN
jgi:carotenoid cleavage dioxygenase-like enzyme